ncbi:Tubulin polyglutamylase TTLL6 [Hondaea fermentalgiana]|uniref:Tubulin--tyrosine ligase-like protein 5 n=1 Tax=Hondaea fermentalgiana TaxID=2315210 RepID=A0A2R5GMH3_9STRA|nr:Tubulin polyglutamylase TTLL6 [Hondaea fermentalgiana]|eukprot:GBG30938.1 Tubulin polyglutamylase TTLL6 [Hondaea fermentalgiana]
MLLLAALHQQQGDATSAKEALRSLVEADAKAENLPARLRLFSLLAAQDDAKASSEATKVMEQTAQLYAQRCPHDIVGLATLRVLAGTSDTDEIQNLETLNDGSALSHVAEMCLLHLALDDASHLAHKCLIHERLAEIGASEIAPPTRICESDAALAAALENTPEGSLWYIKDPAVQRGQGIRIVRGPVDPANVKQWVPAGRRVCLQEAVKPALLDNAKFGVRMHVLVTTAPEDEALRVFVSRDGILTKCGKSYAHDDTTPLGQITCTSVQRGEAGFNREAVKGPASELWDGFQEALPLIDHAALRSIEAVAGKLCAKPSLKMTRAQLFGYDFCFDDTGKPVFIEANISPQFQDAKKLASLRKSLAPLLINTLPRLLRKDAPETFREPCLGWRFVGQVESS